MIVQRVAVVEIRQEKESAMIPSLLLVEKLAETTQKNHVPVTPENVQVGLL